jgi:hypothetical protein
MVIWWLRGSGEGRASDAKAGKLAAQLDDIADIDNAQKRRMRSRICAHGAACNGEVISAALNSQPPAL